MIWFEIVGGENYMPLDGIVSRTDFTIRVFIGCVLSRYCDPGGV